MAIQLRDYQQRFIDELRAEFDAGHNAVLGVAPTGAGKTMCFNYISDNVAKRGKTVFIMVHRKGLVKQTSKALRKLGIAHGIIAAGHPIIDLPIQVCSIQSLIKRLHLFKPPDLLVFDECHHIQSRTYQAVIGWAEGSLILGVTATPWRANGQGFDKIFGTMVLCDDIWTLIENGWLSKPILWAPKIEGVDVSEISIVAGEYNQAELDAMMSQPQIIGDAVAYYKRLVPHRPPTIAFTTSVQTSEDLAARFRLAGVPAAAVHGGMSDDEIYEVIMQLATGKIQVLTSCDLISEGFDLAATAEMDIVIGCVIMLRPTKSLALYMQQIGRALRIADGKLETVIIDHVDNCNRHEEAIMRILGFSDQPIDWWEHFYGRKKRKPKEKVQSLVTCPKCFCVFPDVPICPSCGHKLKEVTAGGGGRELQEKDGELVRVDSAEVLRFKTDRRKAPEPVIRKLEREHDNTDRKGNSVLPCGYW